MTRQIKARDSCHDLVRTPEYFILLCYVTTEPSINWSVSKPQSSLRFISHLLFFSAFDHTSYMCNIIISYFLLCSCKVGHTITTRMSNIQDISSYKKSHPDASTSLWSLLNRCPHALIRRTGFMDSPGCIVPRTRVRNYQKSTQWHHIKWMKNIPQVYQQIYSDYKTILHVLDWHASEYIEQSDSSAMICPLKNFV